METRSPCMILNLSISDKKTPADCRRFSHAVFFGKGLPDSPQKGPPATDPGPSREPRRLYPRSTPRHSPESGGGFKFRGNICRADDIRLYRVQEKIPLRILQGPLGMAKPMEPVRWVRHHASHTENSHGAAHPGPCSAGPAAAAAAGQSEG